MRRSQGLELMQERAKLGVEPAAGDGEEEAQPTARGRGGESCRRATEAASWKRAGPAA